MEILNQAMEFTQQYSLFFLAGMFAVILILVICMTVMNSRMKELQAAYDDFMRGNDGKSLEGILKTVVEDNKRVKIQCKRDIDEIISMKKGLKATYKKIGIMKYDTFRGMAGKLSFSLALISHQVYCVESGIPYHTSETTYVSESGTNSQYLNLLPAEGSTWVLHFKLEV